MTLRWAAALLTVLLLAASGADAAAFRDVRLTLPRAAMSSEDVALRVHAGVLPRGSEIDVYDDRGALLGTISPFGVRGGHEVGTYTIPLHPGTATDRHIAVRLVLTEPGKPPRAPTLREARGVTPIFTKIAR